MGTWSDDITNAFRNLGGIAHYNELYDEIRRLRGNNLPSSWKQIVQRNVQDHSSDSDGFRGRDLYYSVNGVGAGVWGLREILKSSPQASDLQMHPAPDRVLTETYRILRDTLLSRKLKVLHGNACQMCGLVILLSNGKTYAEAHHILPLGAPHNGPDVAENIIVVCPNHHVALDYGAILLDRSKIRVVKGHIIAQDYIRYHNEKIVPIGT